VSREAGIDAGLDPCKDRHKSHTVLLTILNAKRDPLLARMGVTPEQVDGFRNLDTASARGDTTVYGSSFYGENMAKNPGLAVCPLVFLGSYSAKSGGAYLDIKAKTVRFSSHGWTSAPAPGVAGKTFKMPQCWIAHRIDAVLK